MLARKAGSALAGAFASSSSSSHASSSFLGTVSALHTSAVRLAETPRQAAARMTRKRNVEKTAERARIREETKAHVVLGTRPGDDAKWTTCDLAKVLVPVEELAKPESARGTEIRGEAGVVHVPRYLNYGLDGQDPAGTREEKTRLFFDYLPDASAESEIPIDVLNRIHESRGSNMLGKAMAADQNAIRKAQRTELLKSTQLARVVDLRNANARGISFENRRRIITAFSPSGDPTDSGAAEVQVALSTLKIRNMWTHMVRCKKDIHARRALRMNIHQRAKMLKYIKRHDMDRYDRILERCGIEPEAVEGELVV